VKLADFSVRTRLLALCLGLIAILGGANLWLAVLVGQNQRGMQALNEQYSRYAIREGAERAIMRLRHDGSRLANARLAHDDQESEVARLAFADTLKHVDEQLDQVATFDAESAKVIRTALSIAVPLQETLLNDLIAGNQAQVELKGRQLQAQLDTVEQQLVTVGKRETARAVALYESEQRRTRTATRIALTIVAMSTMIGLFLMWRVVGSIIRPLQATTAAIRKVNHGHTDIDLPPISGDEFGDVAVALRQFRDQSEYLRKLAYEDPLTGLGNRARFEETLQRAIDRCRSTSERLALLHFDIDNFRAVNDRLGHKAGDRYLCEAAARLMRFIPSESLLCRYAGDNFVLLIEGLPGDKPLEPRLREVSNVVLRGLAEPYRIGAELLNMSASIGISTYPLDGNTVEQLVSAADAATYVAKKSGRNSLCFAASKVAGHFRRQLGVASDIRRGIERSEFEPFYQPIVNVETGTVIAAEALLRWRHPEHGLLLPATFIQAAEEAGLINRLGERCLIAVHEQCHRWRELGRPLRVAVNLSARQVQSGSILDLLQQLDHEYELDDRLVDFELTESALLDASEGGSAVLAEVRRLGYRIGLDDFGTGYSSLSYLHRLPIDKLKIDQQFVHRVFDSRQALAIISAIIALGRSLDLDVIAEGVETVEQMQQLARLGCTLQQGFHFSRAMPAGDFIAWAQNYEANALLLRSGGV